MPELRLKDSIIFDSLYWCRNSIIANHDPFEKMNLKIQTSFFGMPSRASIYCIDLKIQTRFFQRNVGGYFLSRRKWHVCRHPDRISHSEVPTKKWIWRFRLASLECHLELRFIVLIWRFRLGSFKEMLVGTFYLGDNDMCVDILTV